MLKGKHTQPSCSTAIVATILGNQFAVKFKTINSTHLISSYFDDKINTVLHISHFLHEFSPSDLIYHPNKI